MKENFSLKSLKIAIVVLTLFLITEIVVNSKKIKQLETKSKNSCDSLSLVIDSLSNDLLIEKINVGRYEVTLEELREEDSVSADKFENILYTLE